MLRLVFFGTPEFAAESLRALLEDGHQILAVVTAPDKPAGRGQKPRPSAVKAFALENDLDVLQPTNLKDPDFVRTLRELDPEIQVVVAFRMLPEAVWNLPPKGTYNVHGSLLPNYRGAAPINWAIINGEEETGVTTFKLKHEIDTGNILLQEKIQIGINDTAGEIYARLMHLGAQVLAKSLRLIEEDEAQLKPQVLSADLKHAPKIQKEDCHVRWDRPAHDVHNFIRGMSPFPGAFAITNESATQQWKLHRTDIRTFQPGNAVEGHLKTENGKLFAGCSDGWLEILELQPPGKRKLNASDFINGFRGDLSEIRLQ